jgi:excisionase family DNA binding protein
MTRTSRGGTPAANHPTSQPPRTAHTPREVAAQLGVTYRAVLTLCNEGRLRHRRIGQRLVIPVDAVAEFLAGSDAAA